MAKMTGEYEIPEPDKTGVEPTQDKADDALIVVPVGAEEKVYGSVSNVLEAFYTAGVRATAMPLLLVNQQQSEQRHKQVDDERLTALGRVDELNAENTALKVTLTKYRERLQSGPRIGEQVMTTLGAAALGVGIPASSLSLTAFGVVLLLLGWGLAIHSIRRNNKSEVN